jgi:archaellum biogenesis protein FlaJ (TadC family)
MTILIIRESWGMLVTGIMSRDGGNRTSFLYHFTVISLTSSSVDYTLKRVSENVGGGKNCQT